MTFERTEVIKTFDGTELFFRCYTPKKRESNDAKIRGLVLGVHGFGEHSGRYTDIAEKLCDNGIAFAIFDNRGHGRSGPARGDAQNIHAMILDVIFMVNHARKFLAMSKRDNQFFGLFGHSFGGMLSTYAAAVLGDACPPVFLSSPLFEIKQKVPQWKKVAASTLPRVSPRMPIPIGVEPHNLSENPLNNSAYMADELNLFSVTARFGQTMMESVDPRFLRQSASLITVPVTMVCGAEDKLTNAETVREFAPLFTVKGSSYDSIVGAGHEIFNEREPQKAEAFEHLQKWVDTNLKLASRA